MSSILINIDDSTDINVVYNELRKQYPKFEIIKNDLKAIEESEDEYLFALAEERLKNDDGTRYSEEYILQKYGITEEDLENAEDVEIE
jgi:hypothetical protein